MQDVAMGIMGLIAAALIALGLIAELGPYVVDLARWLLNLTGLTHY